MPEVDAAAVDEAAQVLLVEVEAVVVVAPRRPDNAEPRLVLKCLRPCCGCGRLPLMPVLLGVDAVLQVQPQAVAVEAPDVEAPLPVLRQADRLQQAAEAPRLQQAPRCR
jgi:hypothetical protein